MSNSYLKYDLKKFNNTDTTRVEITTNKIKSQGFIMFPQSTIITPCAI